MSTQNTSPRNSTNELAKGGIVSRRDLLKGALVGAGALAALALPTPLLDIVPGTKPKEAMAATQNVADGIYAFRYYADSNWSLDLLDANPNPINIILHPTNNTIAQYWVVTYDSSSSAYRISPLPGFTPGMVLTATAQKNQVVKTRVDAGEARQRWVFKQNPNGSWSICNKGNTSLCVNLANDTRVNTATIQLYTYSSTDIASQWGLSLLTPAVKTNLHYVKDVNQLYTSDFTLSNARENHPEVLSKPSTGWTMSKDSGGYPDKFTYNGVVSSEQAFSFMYRNVADLKGRAVDIQVDLKILAGDHGGSSSSWPNTLVDLSWQSGASGGNGVKGFFAGICVLRSSRYTLTYTVYDHKTGEKISLKGAWMTAGSLNGTSYGDPCNYYSYTSACSSDTHEGFTYESSSGTVEAYVMKDNGLCNFCEGSWFGRGIIEEDWIGGSDMPRKSVAVVCNDDSPTFRFYNTALTSQCGLWSFPLLMPLGILNPGAPSKSAKITS